MVIYLCLLILIMFVFMIFKNKNKALLLSFILIAIVACLRKYTVGVDTLQFYRAFSKIVSDSSWNYNNFRYEPGFYYLCKLLGKINSEPQILIMFTSIFINMSVYKFIKKNSTDYCLSTILYIIMNNFFSNKKIMRQAIALAILLYGFEFLKDKKYIKYIFAVCIASLFHTVAFSALLLLIFSILPKKRWVYLLEIVLAIVTFVFYSKFFNILTLGFGYSGYMDTEFGLSNYFGSLLSALESLFVMIFLFVVSYNKKKFVKNNYIFRLLSIAIILYIWFSFLVMRMNIFNRISGIYSIYSIVFISYLLDEMKNNNIENYKISRGIILLIYFASFIIISIFRPEWYGVIPYNFFWQ